MIILIILIFAGNIFTADLLFKDLAETEAIINKALSMNAELYSYENLSKARELMNQVFVIITNKDYDRCEKLSKEARIYALKAIEETKKMKLNETYSLRDNPPKDISFPESYKSKIIEEINNKKPIVNSMINEAYVLKAKELSASNFSNAVLLWTKSAELFDSGNYPKSKLYMESALAYAMMAKNDCLLARQKLKTKRIALKCRIDEIEANIKEDNWQEVENLSKAKMELDLVLSNLNRNPSVAAAYLEDVAKLLEFKKTDVRENQISGRILCKYSLLPVSAKVRIERLSDGVEIKSIDNEPETGKFNLKIQSGEKYVINIQATGYLPYAEELTDKNIIKDFLLIPVQPAEIIRLNNIYFEFNEAILKPESIPELKRLIVFMNDYPAIKIEIIGHTDNIGTDEFNQNLSEKRAKAVADYLVNNGINIERLNIIGKGETEPVDENETESGRRNNRRVEIKIIE